VSITAIEARKNLFALVEQVNENRRISEEHRLVYLLDGEDLVILQARYHYT
jgi:Txe/YoeB family toxin of Txe-Axe toxin-antitoxin module